MSGTGYRLIAGLRERTNEREEWREAIAEEKKRDRLKRKMSAKSVENITEIEVPNWKRQTLS